MVTMSRSTRIYLVIFTVVGMTFLFSIGSIDAFATSSMKDRLNKIQDNSILENPPEDKVLVTFKLTHDTMIGENIRVDGLLHNERPDDITRASVTMSFYDGNGKFLGSAIGHPDFMNVESGGSAPFVIDISERYGPMDPNEIVSIKFRVTWEGQ